jgi:hypothetical protein
MNVIAAMVALFGGVFFSVMIWHHGVTILGLLIIFLNGVGFGTNTMVLVIDARDGDT